MDCATKAQQPNYAYPCAQEHAPNGVLTHRKSLRKAERFRCAWGIIKSTRNIVDTRSEDQGDLPGEAERVAADCGEVKNSRGEHHGAAPREGSTQVLGDNIKFTVPKQAEKRIVQGEMKVEDEGRAGIKVGASGPLRLSTYPQKERSQSNNWFLASHPRRFPSCPRGLGPPVFSITNIPNPSGTPESGLGLPPGQNPARPRLSSPCLAPKRGAPPSISTVKPKGSIRPPTGSPMDFLKARGPAGSPGQAPPSPGPPKARARTRVLGSPW
ncbi:hypothetical protein GWK47_046187 [Chionoecetes opilio]|uniref:Uncharacterized protein n=1 Tax=Chionoecetes opilio TaxID=41210 RepID=A0A8J5CUY3_CHIOP|nr:hypothetical protein GWK47_046187 [Chionoecetes opilio]